MLYLDISQETPTDLPIETWFVAPRIIRPTVTFSADPRKPSEAHVTVVPGHRNLP